MTKDIHETARAIIEIVEDSGSNLYAFDIAIKGVCAVIGCGGKAKCKRLCSRCYSNARKYVHISREFTWDQFFEFIKDNQLVSDKRSQGDFGRTTLFNKLAEKKIKALAAEGR